MRHSQQPRERRGFTLVESLVAVALIALAMTGPFIAATRAYVAAQDAKNRLTASFLAQEGIEYVRMLRDNTYLATYQANESDLTNTAFYENFLGGASGVNTSVFGCLGNHSDTLRGGDGSKACALDSTLLAGINLLGGGTDKALQVCADTSCSNKPLYLVNGVYKLSGAGSPSPFTRSIRFYNFGAGDIGSDFEVVVRVEWSSRGVGRSIELASYLSPWQ